MDELTCTFCGEPLEGFAIESPTGAIICLDCVNVLLEIVTAEIVQQQAQHVTLN